jgi:hypothetical protein
MTQTSPPRRRRKRPVVQGSCVSRQHRFTSAIVVGIVRRRNAAHAVADTSVIRSVSMDISQMHQNIKNLPIEKLHDMTFVFSEGD